MGCASHITTRATVWADRGRAARAAARPVTVAPGTGPLPGGAGPQTRRAARADRAGAGPRWREVHPRPRRLVGRRPLGPRRHRRHPGVGRDPAAAPPREPRARRRRPDGRAAGQPARFEVKRSSTRSRPCPPGPALEVLGRWAAQLTRDRGAAGRRPRSGAGVTGPQEEQAARRDRSRPSRTAHAWSKPATLSLAAVSTTSSATPSAPDLAAHVQDGAAGGGAVGGRGCRRRRTWGPATVRRTRP
jgi:hypothetical protein